MNPLFLVALVPLLLVPLVNASDNPLKQSCLGLVAEIHTMKSLKLHPEDQIFTYNKICLSVTGPLANQLNETGVQK